MVQFYIKIMSRQTIFHNTNDILYRLFVIIEVKKNIMGIICSENINRGIIFHIEINKIHKKKKRILYRNSTGNDFIKIILTEYLS